MLRYSNQDEIIKKAAMLINAQDIIAFPTETVYGIGADASSDNACCKIYSIKSRPSNNPLIVHVPSVQKAYDIAEFSEAANLVAQYFWPGPLTLVLPLKKNANLANTVTAGLDTVAIRIPSHDIPIAIMTLSGKIIAAPSANPSGYVSASLAEHVKSHFPDLFVVPDTRNNIIGIESTILDMSHDIPNILRYGFITAEAISQVIKQDVSYINSDAIKAPGMMSKHYATFAKIRLNAITIDSDEYGLGFGDVDFGGLNLSASGNLLEAANNLYKMLRILDTDGHNGKIAVAPIPNYGIGLAINDRLLRAAT